MNQAFLSVCTKKKDNRHNKGNKAGKVEVGQLCFFPPMSHLSAIRNFSWARKRMVYYSIIKSHRHQDLNSNKLKVIQVLGNEYCKWVSPPRHLSPGDIYVVLTPKDETAREKYRVIVS